VPIGSKIPRRKPTINTQRIMTSQKLPTLQECLDAPAYSAVTCSPFSIESPQTQKLYITPRFEKTTGENSFAYYKTLVALYAGIDPNLTFFDAVLLQHMVAYVRKKEDGFMISGIEKAGNALKGQSKRATLESFKRIEKFGYLHCFQRGIGRGNASKYVLGEMYSEGKRDWIKQRLIENQENAKPQNFVRTKPKGKPRGKPFIKGEKVQKSAPFNDPEKVQKSAQKRCKNQHLHPIGNPIYTHTKELPSAFNKENWLKECQRLNPSRDLKDIDYTFHLAESEGAKDGDWMLFVRRYDRSYNPRSKAPTAPARSSPAPRPAVKSSCESPLLPYLDYSNPQVLEHALYDALKNNDPTACIIAGLDPALVESATAKAEARLNESNANRYYRNTNRHNSGKLMKISELEFDGMEKV